jgi:hypothetical protein
MKAATAVTMVLLVAGAGAAAAQPVIPVAASYRTVDAAAAERQYTAGLASLNEGVVVSALAQAMRLRIAHPGEDLGRLHDAVGRLVHEGRTPAIRAKASVAAVVFDSPELFAQEETAEFATADEFFGTVARQLAESMLSAR